MAKSVGFDCIELRECDFIWDWLAPLAYRLQRKLYVWLKAISLTVNRVTGILSHVILVGCDWVLRKWGRKPRQAFLICRKPIWM